MKTSLGCVLAVILTAVSTATYAQVVPIRAALVENEGIVGVEYRTGETLVARSTDAAPAGVELLLPGAKAAPVQFRAKTERDGVVELGPAKVGALALRWRITQKTPSLVERTLEVSADAAQRFSVTFPLDIALDGQYESFSGDLKEAARRKGMRTLREDGWLRVKEGKTTVQELLRVTQEEVVL